MDNVMAGNSESPASTNNDSPAGTSNVDSPPGTNSPAGINSLPGTSNLESPPGINSPPGANSPPGTSNKSPPGISNVESPPGNNNVDPPPGISNLHSPPGTPLANESKAEAVTAEEGYHNRISHPEGAEGSHPGGVNVANEDLARPTNIAFTDSSLCI